MLNFKISSHETIFYFSYWHFIFQCIVQSYLQWLQDSDYSPDCTLCSRSLSDDGCGECVRLTCYGRYDFLFSEIISPILFFPIVNHEQHWLRKIWASCKPLLALKQNKSNCSYWSEKFINSPSCSWASWNCCKSW